jgi:hypothetical protein
MLTEDAAKACVKSSKGGRIEGCYGPSTIAGIEIWEIWVYADDEYATRFVISQAGADSRYFGSFGELCAFLSAVYRVKEEELAKLSPRTRASTVRLYVAATVFLCSVAVLLYLVVKGAEPNLVTFALFSSLIASGATVFYGVWKQASS